MIRLGDCVAVSEVKLKLVVKQPDLSNFLNEQSSFFNTQLCRCKAKLQIMSLTKISDIFYYSRIRLCLISGNVSKKSCCLYH